MTQAVMACKFLSRKETGSQAVVQIYRYPAGRMIIFNLILLRCFTVWNIIISYLQYINLSSRHSYASPMLSCCPSSKGLYSKHNATYWSQQWTCSQISHTRDPSKVSYLKNCSWSGKNMETPFSSLQDRTKQESRVLFLVDERIRIIDSALLRVICTCSSVCKES